MTAADCHPQFRITGAVDPTDRRCVAAPFKRFQGAQPGHRVAARQPGNGGGGVQLFSQRQHGLTMGFRCDRGVQVGEVAVAGQLGLAATPGCQAVAAQLVSDGFHHQFMFAAIFIGAQQLPPGIPLPRRAGQGIAAQPTGAQAEQPFRRCTEEGITGVPLLKRLRRSAAARFPVPLPPPAPGA